MAHRLGPRRIVLTSVAIEEAVPGVALVTLDRPEVANAVNTEMGRGLLEAWTGLSSRDDLRCVILKGAGRHFAAGADLKERNGMRDEAWAEQHGLFEKIVRAQLACPVPVIAAVQGAAFGGGCEMVLAADFAWAADTARFRLPEASVGIMPGTGGAQLLTRAAGTRRALELLTTAREFSAAEALQFGVVNYVTSPLELMDQVLDAATRIASNAPLAVRALKRVVRGGAAMELADAMELELAAYASLVETADRREGVAAFNEKRAPIFEGR